MFDRMNEYLPWHLRIPKALARTLIVHSGLWLGLLEVQSRWRYLVALLLVLSGFGAYLLIWNYNLVTLIAASAGLGWLAYKVLRGESLDD